MVVVGKPQEFLLIVKEIVHHSNLRNTDLLQEYNGRDECENAEIKLVKKTGLAAAAVSAETLGLKNKD